MRWTPAYLFALTLLTLVGCCIAAVLSWLIINVVGWFGLALIGLAILMIASWWSLDDSNAAPSYTSGAGAVYAAQYRRLFGRMSPEDTAAARAQAADFNRCMYLIRTVGVALLVLGIYGLATRGATSS